MSIELVIKIIGSLVSVGAIYLVVAKFFIITPRQLREHEIKHETHFKKYNKLEIEVIANKQAIAEIRTANKYMAKTLDELTKTIKDQHELDRSLMSELINKIK